MSENNKKLHSLISSDSFLIVTCVAIFLLSILIRSIIGIGPDTGVYLDFGQKIAEGKKYYYDFFEGNFPLSFYFYALQYKLSNFLHISPIYMSEIVVNILGIFSIFLSAKFLQKTTIYDNKAHYNLIIIAFYLAYFLRNCALEISEFGTKTSFLFALLFPYISSSFVRKFSFSRSELIWRGIFMGLMPCLKPHYLLFIIFVELYNFGQRKNIRFLLELDKLIMALIGVLYLFLMIKFIPQFFEFIIPMQKSFYYGDAGNFVSNVTDRVLWYCVVSSVIFLIFLRIDFGKNDLVLTIFLFETYALIATENLVTIDQLSVLYSIVTICYAKWIYDLLVFEWKYLKDKYFIILFLLIISFFVSSFLLIIGFIGFFYWIILPIFFIFLFFKNKDLTNNLNLKLFVISFVHLVLLVLIFVSFRYLKITESHALSLSFLLLILFFLEKYLLNFSKNFSSFTIFLIFGSLLFFCGSYLSSIKSAISQHSVMAKNYNFSQKVSYYSKIYSPKKENKILLLNVANRHVFPLLNYLEKENPYKGSAHNNLLYYSEDSKFLYSKDFVRSRTIEYLFEDLKQKIKDDNLKVLFVNSDSSNEKGTFCVVGFLEYYFKDPEFRKIFLQNFQFKNRIIISDKVQKRFLLDINEDSSNKVNQQKYKILYDFEVYVRREKQK